ncbi:hypothetical protein LT85_4094 [Collimonas arenae]|uniref:Uncharacterized protein n=1 Tax=Collimonas arenae TaxID=279058 RepID=A0A0A1FK66_9BURK|nr:hypothetical protein LT85_4094 [Collimonas arenae]
MEFLSQFASQVMSPSSGLTKKTPAPHCVYFLLLSIEADRATLQTKKFVAT